MLEDTFSPVARIEINPPLSQALMFRDLPLSEEAKAQEYLETQIEVLKSDELAVEVINKLDLLKQPEFAAAGRQQPWMKGFHDFLDPHPSHRITGDKTTDAALNAFASRLSVSQVRTSRLIEVRFSSHDPRLAANVANTLVSLFIARNYRKGYETTAQAANWLSEQLEDLRKKVQRSNEAAIAYQRENGIPADTGAKDGDSVSSQQVLDFSRQLTQAQVDRMQTEAQLKVAGGKNGEPAVNDSVVAQHLRQRIADTKAQLAQARAVFGDNHSSVRRLAGELNELELQLRVENDRIGIQMNAAYEAAILRERMLKSTLDGSRASMGDLNSKLIRYRVLKEEAKANEDLYNTIFARLREAAITAGLKSTNLRVVDQARVLDAPTQPNRLRLIAAGFLVALFSGVGLAFLQDRMDPTVRTPQEMMNLTGVAPIIMVPHLRKKTGPMLARFSSMVRLHRRRALSAVTTQAFFRDRPRSPQAEAIRNLHASLHVFRSCRDPRVIIVASPTPGDGKTTIAVNLAMALAQDGRTCIVDTDLRRPGVEKVLGTPRHEGLTEVLNDTATTRQAIVPVPGYRNLFLLGVGQQEAAPEHLGAWRKMQAIIMTITQDYSHVVIDCPPLIPFGEARALTAIADGVLLVARSEKTPREAVQLSVEMLQAAGAKALGVVLNGVDAASPVYKYYRRS